MWAQRTVYYMWSRSEKSISAFRPYSLTACYYYYYVMVGVPVEVLQFATYRTILVALFCGCLTVAVCLLVLGCRQRWLARRRLHHRERKLRQQAKHRQCHDEAPSDPGLSTTFRNERPKVEFAGTSPRDLAGHNVCHCLPRGLRRKSPATAVIRRGRSFESLPLDRRGAGGDDGHDVATPPLTYSTSAAVMPWRVTADLRSDLVQISTNDDDSTSGAERWKPITVAGETMFPVQPSAAIFLSYDDDNNDDWDPVM